MGDENRPIGLVINNSYLALDIIYYVRGIR